jgi:hypothetical protein
MGAASNPPWATFNEPNPVDVYRLAGAGLPGNPTVSMNFK